MNLFTQLTPADSIALLASIAIKGSLLFLFALNLDIVDGVQSSISVFGQENSSLFDIEDIIYGVVPDSGVSCT